MATKFFLYLALASPLWVNRSLYFPFITGKTLFFRSAVEFALLFFILELISSRKYWPVVIGKARQPLFVACAIFAAIFVLTTLTAVNPTAAFWSNFERSEGGWQIIHYLLFFALLTVIFNSKRDWIGLIRWQVVIGFLISLYAVGQRLLPPTPFIVAPGSISGTLGNSSYLSIYLIFGLFFLIWLFCQERSNWLRVLWLTIGLLQILVLYWARTSASFLAIAGGALIIAWLITRYFHKHRGQQFSKRMVALCYLASLLIASLIVAGAILLVVQKKGGLIDIYSNLSPRFWTWGSALAGFIERPLLGWGAENFPYAFDKYYNPNHYGIESWFDRTHNIFLEYLISGGIVLLLAYLGMFVAFYKQLLTSKRDWLWSLLAGLPVIYLINGLTLFEVLPIYLSLFLFFAFFINYQNGFAEVQTPPTIKATINPLLKWVVFYSIIVVITSSMYLTIYAPLQKNLLLINALKTNNKKPQEIFENFRTALNFPSPVGQAETSQQLLSFTYDFFNWMAEKKLNTPENKESVEIITQLNNETFAKNQSLFVGVKNSYIFIDNLIRAYNMTGNKKWLEQARELVAKGLELAPTRIELLNQQRQIAEMEKDDGTAQRVNATIKRLRPDLH